LPFYEKQIEFPVNSFRICVGPELPTIDQLVKIPVCSALTPVSLIGAKTVLWLIGAKEQGGDRQQLLLHGLD